MNELGLMERFANPELFKGLTFGEKMAGGGVTLLMGMGMTFLILCIIWGCIALMGKIFRASEKKADAKTAAATATLKAAYN
ncbi:MAG: OadG family protein, partial [Firmicutes bacterium]|nr:OadG family protein [Bacillota bacterium]